MGNERSFMELCRVVGDLIIVPFGSEVMVKWLGWLLRLVVKQVGLHASTNTYCMCMLICDILYCLSVVYK